jgi:hypothetical protein
MILLAALGVLTGVLLGLRFTILILVPAIIVVWVFTISIDIVGGMGFWWIALDLFVVSIALQVGYVVGAALSLLRHGVASVLESEPDSAPQPLRRHEQGLAWAKIAVNRAVIPLGL